jgi:hypothetical protein
MHECAPAHFIPSVQHVHANTFEDRWIGRPIARPERSPDLLRGLNAHPILFLRIFSFGDTPVDNKVTFHHRIIHASQAILNYRDRFKACTETHEGQSERTFSDVFFQL